MQFSDIEQYSYELPPELIRKEGVEPRDSARLFVYDTASDTVTHATFRDVAKFLPEQTLVVLNNTRVVPARLWLRKETGGKIEVFVLANEIQFASGSSEISDTQEIPVLVDRKCSPGWKLFFPNGDFFEVVRQEENKFFVVLKSDRALESLIDEYGETPIPHYLEEDALKDASVKNEREMKLRERYQTVFAQSGASVAAPTASLHFTDHVFQSLAKKGIETTEVTLNVGLGTFAPLQERHWRENRLHAEWYEISKQTAQAIIQTKGHGGRVMAVGTTALRTLEGAVLDGYITPGQGMTDIFIRPPYQFQIADILMTNFHLPKTSLMLLVDAFLEHKGAKRRIMDLYRIAIQEKYAFYSFGDSMLIL